MMVDTDLSMDGQFVRIGYDIDGQPCGIVALDHGTVVEVPLDRIQLRAFAERILRATEYGGHQH